MWMTHVWCLMHSWGTWPVALLQWRKSSQVGWTLWLNLILPWSTSLWKLSKAKDAQTKSTIIQTTSGQYTKTLCLSACAQSTQSYEIRAKSCSNLIRRSMSARPISKRQKSRRKKCFRTTVKILIWWRRTRVTGICFLQMGRIRRMPVQRLTQTASRLSSS